jgi:hypothetical protein
MKERIIVYDFDTTLIYTAEPIEGRKKWLEVKGENFPHPTGWFGKSESLNLDVFYPTLNEWTYKHYLEDIKDENNYVCLCTGRLQKMKSEVINILNFHDLKFNDVYCNTGGETFNFKIKLFEKLISENKNVKEFKLYDDRHEHLIKFVDWRKVMLLKYDIKITIIDIINKIEL